MSSGAHLYLVILVSLLVGLYMLSLRHLSYCAGGGRGWFLFEIRNGRTKVVWYGISGSGIVCRIGLFPSSAPGCWHLYRWQLDFFFKEYSLQNYAFTMIIRAVIILWKNNTRSYRVSSYQMINQGLKLSFNGATWSWVVFSCLWVKEKEEPGDTLLSIQCAELNLYICSSIIHLI